jgi:tetratricopeptide (TPR) repeat protein
MIRNALVAAVAVLAALTVRPQPAEGEIDRALVGRQIMRLALMDYRLQPQAGPGDAAIAADVLEIAAGFRPEDPAVLRYLIEAQREAGDEEAVIRATRTLVRLDPGDEVAMLRLLSWTISRRQTVEERLAAYDYWIDGDGGKELARSPAILSRLALDAALMHRELGEDEAFLTRLAQATSLDITNKEAAALAAAVHGQRSDDPIARLELAINVLLADPVDPNLHFSLAGQLAHLGLFEAAQRFHLNGERLIAASGGNPQDPALVNETSALLWHTLGPAGVIASFDSYLLRTRDSARRTRARLTEMNQPLDEVPEPADIRLSLEQERYRLFAAMFLNDRVTTETSIVEMEATVAPVLERLRNEFVATDPADLDRRGLIASRVLQFATEGVSARLLANVQPREAAANLESIRAAYGEELAEQLSLLGGLVTLRTVSAEAAIPELNRFAERSVLGSLGLGLAYEELGRREEAIVSFERAATFAPLSAAGTLARSKADALRGGPLPLTPVQEAASRVVEAVPAWVDLASAGPRRFVRLEAGLSSESVGPYDEVSLNIQIRHLLPVPIAVGGSRTIDTRFAIAPSLTLGGYPVFGQLSPEVADIHRKLRLEPGERLSSAIVPDAGLLGWLSEIKSASRVRCRWSAIQGFVVGENTPYRPGPLSLTTETPMLVRSPDPDGLITPTEMIRHAQSALEPRLARLLLTLRAALLDVDRPTGALSAPDAEAIARVLAARYPSLSRELRAAVTAVMPTALMRPEMAPLDAAILAETDPDLLRLALVSRAHDAQTPALQRAGASADSGLAAFADNLSRRLAGPTPAGAAFLGPPGSHRPPPPENPEAVQP